MGRPSYVVFDEDYSAAEITRLLGVVVTDVCRPMDKNTPKVDVGGKLDFVDKYLLSVRPAKGVQIKTVAIRGTAAEANIASIFGLSGNWSIEETYELTSEAMQTVSLERIDDVFADLMNSHSEEIRELFRSASITSAYMLVGYKTSNNPTITKTSKRTKDASFTASTKGIAAAMGTPLPIEASASAGFKMSRETLLKSTVESDRAFAGLFVKLAWEVDGIKILPNLKIQVKRKVVQQGIHHPSMDTLAFSGENVEEEEDSDGETDEATEFDTLI